MREDRQAGHLPKRVIKWLGVALGAAIVVWALLIWRFEHAMRDPLTVAYRATIQSDLRELDYKQREFLRTQQHFAGSLDELSTFRTISDGVRIEIWRRNPRAYVAIGWHDLWPEGVCIATDTAGAFTADAKARITCYGEFR